MRDNSEHNLAERMVYADDALECHSDLKELQLNVLRSAKIAFEAILGKTVSDKIQISEIEPFLESKELNEAYRIVYSYARYGILRDMSVKPSDRADFIYSKMERLNSFYVGLSEHFKDIKGQVRLQKVLSIAYARWALDHNTSVPVEGLALLADVGIQAVRNLISKKKLRQETRNRIYHNDAWNYVKDKRVFYNSIWQTQESFVPEESEPDDKSTEEFVIVPVSREGIVFHPGNKFECGFILGKSDMRVKTFQKALKELTQMPRPKWTHKRSDGGRSVISGHTWERMTLTELQAYADNLSMRHQHAVA